MSKHRTSADMYPMVEEWQQSNESQQQFCQSRDISPSVFSYWVKKYQASRSVESTFTEILPQLEEKLEIHYPNGVQIKLPAGSSPSTIHALIHLS